MFGYDYYAETTQIQRLADKYEWAAKAHIKKSGEEEVVLGEFYGATEREAEEKAIAKAEAWIKEQQQS